MTVPLETRGKPGIWGKMSGPPLTFCFLFLVLEQCNSLKIAEIDLKEMLSISKRSICSNKTRNFLF